MVALYFDPAQPFAVLTFDVLGRNPPHEITSDDLLAVTLLDVRWSTTGGVRDTRASKLLARKRARLVPITDSIVVTAVGTPGITWPTLQGCFRDAQFRQSVMALRPSHIANVSLLRVFDVAIWMLYSKSKAARKARQAVGITPSI